MLFRAPGGGVWVRGGFSGRALWCAGVVLCEAPCGARVRAGVCVGRARACLCADKQRRRRAGRIVCGGCSGAALGYCAVVLCNDIVRGPVRIVHCGAAAGTLSTCAAPALFPHCTSPSGHTRGRERERETQGRHRRDGETRTGEIAQGRPQPASLRSARAALPGVSLSAWGSDIHPCIPVQGHQSKLHPALCACARCTGLWG